MNEKQKIFADEYIRNGGNATKAYMKAYGVKGEATAAVNANKLLRNTKIGAYIRARNDEMANERIADMQEIKSFWTKILRSDEERTPDRLKASEFIAKTNGAFIDVINADMQGEIKVVLGEAEKYAD